MKHRILIAFFLIAGLALTGCVQETESVNYGYGIEMTEEPTE